MPQTKYTNADLKRFERKPLSIAVERDREVDTPEPEGQPEVDVAKLLADAKGTLARANRFGDETYGEPPAPDAATLARSSRQPSVTDPIAGRLGKMVSDYKARHDYAMSQPAEIALSSLARGIAMPLAFMGSGPAMVGTSAANLAERGTEGITEDPLSTAFDVGMMATPALRGLRTLTAPRRAAQAAAAQAAREAETVGETVSTARDFMAKGATRKEAAQRAGWPLGQSKATRISHLTQIPEEDMVQSMLRMRSEGFGPDAALRAHADQAKRLARSKPPNPKRPDSIQGLMDALDSRISNIAPPSALEDIGGGLGKAGPVVKGRFDAPGEANMDAISRYAKEGGGFFEDIKRQAERLGISVPEYLQSLRQNTGTDFVMPSAKLPRIR